MIPPDIAATMRWALYVADESFANGLIAEDPPTIPLRIGKALAYLDTLPAAPAPDWSKAPEWAQWWAVEPDGNINWHEEKPSVILFYWTSEKRMERVAGGFVTLPIGVDWRTTLVARPTETP